LRRGRYRHQKAQLQQEVDRQRHAQPQSHGQGHVALGVASFACQIHGGAKPQQAEQDASTADGTHHARELAAGPGVMQAEIAPVPRREHQAQRYEQRHHQLPAGEPIDPAGQPAHASQIDPGHQHQQHQCKAKPHGAEHLPLAAIGREPGQAAGEVLHHRQHFNRGQGEVGDPGTPATDEASPAAMAEQWDLGQCSRARHQRAQFGKHQSDAEGHEASGDPGQQAGGTRKARGIERCEQPARADGARHHGQGEAAQSQAAPQRVWWRGWCLG